MGPGASAGTPIRVGVIGMPVRPAYCQLTNEHKIMNREELIQKIKNLGNMQEIKVGFNNAAHIITQCRSGYRMWKPIRGWWCTVDVLFDAPAEVVADKVIELGLNNHVECRWDPCLVNGM